MTDATNIDYLLVERALSGTVPLHELNSEEQSLCQNYKPVFEVGRMAGRMAQGYYAHKAAIEIAADARSDNLIPGEPRIGHAVPVGDVIRQDGTGHAYDIRHYLNHARTNRDMVENLKRVWLIGSLIAVGDALSDLHYLNHAPFLELIYHLRNGIAHGNTFNFTVGKRKPGLRRLADYPANNGPAHLKTAYFEITPDREGQPVLFDFMGAGDILDLLQSIEWYLTFVRERVRMGELVDLLNKAAAAA